MSSKVFVGYACVCVAGAVAFYLSRVYLEYKKHDTLEARARISQKIANIPETEETPRAFTKAYLEEVKRKTKELQKSD